jgi:TetR/AcrR family transcriptional repressor of nem operon
MRVRDPDAKRKALTEAGLAIADESGLTRLSVNQVVAAAGVAKGSFFHHFGDRAAFLVALHRTFHDRLAALVTAAIENLPPGRGRLLAGTRAYLDGCRQDKGTRALLTEARAEPALLAEVARRNEQFTDLAGPDFAAMGWSRPAPAARLWVVMAREVAIAESAAGTPLPDLRAALTDYLGE